MGFDKPDLGFVVHLGAPSSPVSYYQQVGRAGRAVEHADVLLLPGPEDLAIWQWFATSSMPREDHAAAVLTAMADGKAWSVARLETVADVRRSRLELLLKVLAVDGAVERVQGGWRSTGSALGLRRRPVRPGHPHARGRAAGDDRLRPAGRRGRVPDGLPAGRRSTTRPPRPAAGATSAPAPGTPPTSRRPPRRPPPRRSTGPAWSSRPAPSGRPAPTGSGVDVKGKIAAADQLEPGRAVARLTDLGWGQRLRTLLGDDGVGGIVVLDLEAPGIEEDPDAAFDVPGAALDLRRPPGRRAAHGVRARARRPGTGRSARARSWRCPSRRRPAAGDRSRPGAGPPGAAAVPGGDVAAARRPDRPARRQQRLPPGRGLGPDRRRPGAAGAAGRGRLRAGAARRRPGRLPLDDDGGRPGAAPGRGGRRCCRSRWRSPPERVCPQLFAHMCETRSSVPA